MRRITHHYVDGRFVESHGREEMDTSNPSTGEVIGRVTLGDEEDARRAVAAAKRAFATFSRTTRRSATTPCAGCTRPSRRAHDLTAIMMEEYGAPPSFAEASTRRAATSFLTAEAALREIPLTRSVGKATVTLEPLGVAALITPWNASSSFVCAKLAHALAAGCTAVVKPSEMSALQTAVLLEALDAARLPEGLLNVVNGRGDVVGAELTRHPDVAKISFTGSTAVGKTIARDAAATMKRLTLELGGKSPNVLLDDVDLDETVPLALATAFMNSGQACIAGTRLLVPARRLGEVKDAILRAMAAVKVGRPGDPGTTIGPMVSKRQYDRVQGYIAKGIEEGAALLVGGSGHPAGLEAGNFVRPTVFTGVTRDMTIAREEIFGPVLAVITYDSEAEAIELANDTTYGLAAYVSSADRARAERVASQLAAGRVMVNGLYDDPSVPFGGFKQSGIGRESGAYGVEAYLEPKALFS